MLKHALSVVKKAKLKTDPFPYIFVKNLLPKKELLRLNKILPSFNEVGGNDVLYQSSSKTKKTLLPSSIIYKKLSKEKTFKDVDKLFKKLKPAIIKKFKPHIKAHVKKKFHNSKLNYHSSFSLMKKGYVKSSHLDRRDHLLHILFYPYSDGNSGGNLQLDKLRDHKKTYDIFPGKEDLKIHEKLKVKNNHCLFTLNVPWAYHSVSKYNGKKDRKYFYVVYDFPIKKSGSLLKNRKKGYNDNIFWNSQVKIKSGKRKKVFLSE
tara:strand:- start:312 stop:1097 length:786 start_codon:yes stop_codon:yes gene_type:complete